ncbi:FAD-dependent monooxygenase [Amycolatopsis sp. PS_44_ISF1]|uniref:FAD-dependent oxidoreductase n=1 Tax=Amycolatopsis sp. PS_44_ISF1 TaxID=2974917 RepID=UPI0028E05F1D|nr:FAD-dependent monooxygenase [Amycolatopsis sp. PS_44_ISF1]MDT8910586.1 FAD-dependent monooxygenase [Amycolatopsis sp. PS_44_ISF1]
MARVLIAGGGIAGTITAIALQEVGHEPVLYEASGRGVGGVGAFLTLAVNGLDALRPFGLKPLVKAAGFDTPRMTIGLGNGHRLAEFPLGEPLPDGTTSQTIGRADLYRALREEADRRGVPTSYDKRLTAATQTSSQVTAQFEDGTATSGDLLIGADGLRSRVRRIIDPTAPEPRYVPLLNTGGRVTGLDLGDEPGVMHMAFGRKAFFAHVVHPDRSVWWFANVPRATEPDRAELAALRGPVWRAALLRLFARDRFPAARIIEATEEIYRPWATYDFPSVPVWHRGRIGIIGDAAHATSPAAGQGASMAIEDAVTLARCLRDVPETALATFESLRRTRVEAVVAQGKRNSDAKGAPGPVGRLLRDFFLARTLSKPSAEDPNEFMWSHRIDWAAPVSA